MRAGDLAGPAAVAGVGAWILLTVIANLPHGESLLLRVFVLRRLLALIPRWSFFAPDPVHSDVSLLFRDRIGNGGLSVWRDTNPGSRRPSVLRPLFNPDARSFKAVSDASNGLIAAARSAGPGTRPQDLSLNVPYLLLLNHVAGFGIGPGVEARQFALVRHNRHEQRMAVVFVSGFHVLEAEDSSAGR
ncbi:hypothetical protein EDD29_4501 [Actinocorallia herbida]|uniref:Uncharacterized protein n=1 Tax=Actinocorallia herbida TaxID=58109 RepID=A0A3N1D057_9ACTN|nr:hypothetical protein [Actinocorallia herbida]ROO86917.1 hypothetical protein EDD29_4501 [Actinocorallia herbida]